MNHFWASPVCNFQEISIAYRRDSFRLQLLPPGLHFWLHAAFNSESIFSSSA
jgi:hypothetical protein